VVCTNEGNADMGTSLPPLHIACMGIEKIVPRERDLGVFLRLLARLATGQPITTYTTHFSGPRAGGELHIVIVDNGRSDTLGREALRDSLACIRCGACMNTCPVYRRSGGHSYRYTVPGPIGSVLAPQRDPGQYATLPFASTLCGSCADVCPVRIDLHHQLLALRQDLAQKRLVSWQKRLVLRIAAMVLAWSASSRAVADLLWNRARPLVFSTGLPPSVPASARAAVEIVRSSDGDERRRVLAGHAHRLRGRTGSPAGWRAACCRGCRGGCCTSAGTCGAASASCPRCRGTAFARSTGGAVASRDHILAALRRHAPPAVAAPELAGLGVTFADPVA
jgi:heterodisulfide reductase subunit C